MKKEPIPGLEAWPLVFSLGSLPVASGVNRLVQPAVPWDYVQRSTRVPDPKETRELEQLPSGGDFCRRQKDLVALSKTWKALSLRAGTLCNQSYGLVTSNGFPIHKLIGTDLLSTDESFLLVVVGHTQSHWTQQESVHTTTDTPFPPLGILEHSFRHQTPCTPKPLIQKEDSPVVGCLPCFHDALVQFPDHNKLINMSELIFGLILILNAAQHYANAYTCLVGNKFLFSVFS